MVKFIPGGPPRFAHQKRGLQKLIKTGGVTALLFEPGLGKTAVILDYASLLALKSPTNEARVLVVCPLVAVDTWVSQARIFVSPQVGFWAEALGGRRLERAEALAARGGNPHTYTQARGLQKPPSRWFEVQGDGTQGWVITCRRCGRSKRAKRDSTIDGWWKGHLSEHGWAVPAQGAVASCQAPRALHHARSLAVDFRHAEGHYRPMSASQGPQGVRGPRLVIEVINIDTVTSREKLRSKTMADVMLDAIRRYAPDLVVVDESHKIKSVTGNASQLMARVAKHVRRRVILTGTVAPASPLDVFAQWRFLEPFAFGEVLPDGTRKEATFGKFQQRFAIYGGWGGREIKGYIRLDEMQKIMAVNASVARKDDALDLPPTTDVVLHVNLSSAERSAYAEMKKQLVTTLQNGAQVSATNRLTQMMRLRQITSGHLPEDRGPMQVIGTSKAEKIKSLVHDTLIGEKRIVIFALFSLEIEMLSTLLTPRHDEHVLMTIEGETPQHERVRMRKLFGSDNPARIILLCQIKTMSLAVNELVTASHAIFASLSQQRDDLEQAKARLDRTGQTRPVTFWFAIAPGTVDEIILKSHRERTDLENALLRHINEI